MSNSKLSLQDVSERAKRAGETRRGMLVAKMRLVSNGMQITANPFSN